MIIAAAILLLLFALSQNTATNMQEQEINPLDESTWPNGDIYWTICRCIARAEGYGVRGSVPTKLHNPGDISDGQSTYGSEFHSGSFVTTFPDDRTGWNWLYNKIHKAATGDSTVYSPDMTWQEFAQKWAGDWQSWMNNVCGCLNVDPSSTIRDYINA